MKKLLVSIFLLVWCLLPVQAEVKRTPSGKPDLSGFYDTGNLTPLQRPEFLGETEYLYTWVANLINWAAEWPTTTRLKLPVILTERRRLRGVTAITRGVLVE